MTERSIFTLILLVYFVASLLVFISLFFVKAPYGRYFQKNWGMALPNHLGWMFMEAPSAVLFVVLFYIGTVPKNTVLIVFFLLWEAHYFHRSFIYPFTLQNSRKKMPIVIMSLAILFNLGNTYVNGRFLFRFSDGYPESWILDPRFIIGIVIFVTGFVINRWADFKLKSLRKGGDAAYYIPRGGLFRWISCPNYFGEIIEWIGWALATWSIPGTIFAIWTFANLAPRAYSHHNWYKKEFLNYPKERKALIPGIW
jgi:3-oxo-5-alpha-steroid 4-dehydrogenase 1